MSFQLPRHPHLFEANALIYLRRVSQKYSKPLTISQIPQEEWRNLNNMGFHLVWLMGVWKRSVGARRIALKSKALAEEYDQALPGWKIQDVAGSPYAVYDYSLETLLGKEDELKSVREALNAEGLGLMLDFVPNHLAYDHPMTQTDPDCFIRGTESDFFQNPDSFFQSAQKVYLAHGKDPYFPAWTDSVQINYFSPKARAFAIKTLLAIAEAADGVRCDMAMLGIHRIFEANWKNHLSGIEPPAEEFWREVISAVKKKHPRFIFMAEAYWNLEWELQQMGFDFTYDKKLYDRLLNTTPPMIRGHLWAEKRYQEKSVRFIENHDEKRAVYAFGADKSLAAAAIMATIPGLRFFFDGQADGKKIHSPIQLATEPLETGNPAVKDFYDRLLKYIELPCFHQGEWRLFDAGAVKEGNQAFENIMAWGWRFEKQMCIAVINYSAMTVQARVRMPVEWLDRGQTIQLLDHATGQVYDRDPKELTGVGLYVELGPWKSHLFQAQP